MRALECSPDDVMGILGRVFRPKANPHGVTDLPGLLQGCRCYRVFDDDGSAIAAYALKGQGSEIWVQAAAGSAAIDLCDVFDDLIPRHGPGFQSIGFRTYRRGLCKKAGDRGYRVIDETDGYTMRKTL